MEKINKPPRVDERMWPNKKALKLRFWTLFILSHAAQIGKSFLDLPASDSSVVDCSVMACKYNKYFQDTVRDRAEFISENTLSSYWLWLRAVW